MKKLILPLLLLMTLSSASYQHKKSPNKGRLFVIETAYSYYEQGYYYTGGFIEITDSSFNIIKKDTIIIKKLASDNFSFLNLTSTDSSYKCSLNGNSVGASIKYDADNNIIAIRFIEGPNVIVFLIDEVKKYNL